MMWPRKRTTMDAKITWRLWIIALSMIAAFILAVSNVAPKGVIESTHTAGSSGGNSVESAGGNDPICFSTAVFRICDEHGVPPKLVYAIIQVESQGNPRAVSRKGALGLMQLMPEMIKLYRLVDPFDPLANIDAGVRHLKYLLSEFSGNLPLTLAAYNAGPGAVRKYRGVPPYPETKKYLQKVMSEYQRERSEWELPTPLREGLLESRAKQENLSPEPPRLLAFRQAPMPASNPIATP